MLRYGHQPVPTVWASCQTHRTLEDSGRTPPYHHASRGQAHPGLWTPSSFAYCRLSVSGLARIDARQVGRDRGKKQDGLGTRQSVSEKSGKSLGNPDLCVISRTYIACSWGHVTVSSRTSLYNCVNDAVIHSYWWWNRKLNTSNSIEHPTSYTAVLCLVENQQFPTHLWTSSWASNHWMNLW